MVTPLAFVVTRLLPPGGDREALGRALRRHHIAALRETPEDLTVAGLPSRVPELLVEPEPFPA